jgi:hypothetical protein
MENTNQSETLATESSLTSPLTAPSTATNPLSKLFDSDSPPRLGMDLGRRLRLTALAAFSAGMVLGASHGGVEAAYRFRAENAHRFPTTATGWFLYHKTKNYKAMFGAITDGMRMGVRISAATLAFCLLEETVDYARYGQQDFMSTVIAGVSLAGLYSLRGKNLFLRLRIFDMVI